MIQITFAGTAAELREEMLTLLGINKTAPVPDTEVTGMVLQNIGHPVQWSEHIGMPTPPEEEPKRGRGRPRKEAKELMSTDVAPTPQPEVQSPESVQEPEVQSPEPVVITYTEQDQAAAKAALEVLKEVVKPEPEVVPTPEPVGTPCPGNAQDLMSAAMEIVKGDNGKKIELVKLLQTYGAKTINTLAPEHYAEFWVKVQGL